MAGTWIRDKINEQEETPNFSFIHHRWNFSIMRNKLLLRTYDFWCYFIFDALSNKGTFVADMFETFAISRRQIAPKSPLVYTCDFHREFERDTWKVIPWRAAERDKNRIKNRLCKRTYIYILIRLILIILFLMNVC